MKDTIEEEARQYVDALVQRAYGKLRDPRSTKLFADMVRLYLDAYASGERAGMRREREAAIAFAEAKAERHRGERAGYPEASAYRDGLAESAETIAERLCAGHPGGDPLGE